ncbi:MAG: Protein-export protein SecB [Holosporales bacterium]
MSEETIAVNAEQPVTILGQFIKDLSFENPDPISFLALQDAQPEINMDVNINAASLNESHFEIILKVKLTAKHEEKTVFLCELAYSTIAQINEEVVGKENMGPLLMVHIPHLAFPFIRAILYNIIREGGLPPFAIHPIDFAGMYEQNSKNQENHTIN